MEARAILKYARGNSDSSCLGECDLLQVLAMGKGLRLDGGKLCGEKDGFDFFVPVKSLFSDGYHVFLGQIHVIGSFPIFQKLKFAYKGPFFHACLLKLHPLWDL